MNITKYHQNSRNEKLEQFYEALLDMELQFLASELFLKGFADRQQLDEAVERAIRICHTACIPIRNNFKSIYIGNEGGIARDWKLSSLGRKLVIVNADASIPFVAKAQVELLTNYL